jgi:cell division transport system permease protein
MKISTVGRHFREGAKNIVRNGWMSFASASAISISLFILGVFLLLAVNVNHWTKEVENQVEINVYLEMTATATQVTELQNEIGSIPEVSKVEFVSKDQGIDILREKLGADGDSILEGFDGDGNPLPDAFNVQVTEPRQVSIAAEKIEALDQGQKEPRIWKVDYGKGTVESLFRVTKIVQNVGLILVIGLAFTAMFLISNTIKLTILARRREIGIMKLVGATNNFIRWPFFIEGAMLGIVGSLIPVIILLYGYWQLVDRSRLALGTLMIQMMPLSEIGPKIALLLLGIGFLIGVWGSTISVRKFLKV